VPLVTELINFYTLLLSKDTDKVNDESNSGQSYHPQSAKSPKWPLSGPCLTLVSLNIEGLTPEKEQLISEIVREHRCEVLCLQETHREIEHRRPNIKGMTLIIERLHEKSGSALFVKDNTQVKSAFMSCVNDIEILTVDL